MTDLQREFERYGWAWDPTREPNPDQLKSIKMGLANPLSTIQFTAPQLIAHYYGKTHPRHILSLDKGMGKTITYLSVGLQGEPEHVIIVCPTNAMAAQRRELQRHFPSYADRFVIVRGQSAQRHKLWRTPGAKVFICTMATLQADLGKRSLQKGSDRTSERSVPKWVDSSALDFLAIDEFHKYIRRRSASWETIKGLTPQRMILASGSPVSSGPHDLWPALHLCDRKLWSSYWKYVDTFCETVPGFRGQGKEILGPKNVEGWRNAIAPTVFHRKKDPRDYPEKSRFFMDVDLPTWQRKLHDDLRETLMAFTEEGTFLVARNQGDALYRARLSLICPKALDSSLDVGAGIHAIAEDGEDLSHYVITTPFRAPVPHLKAYLESQGRRVWVLMGGLDISPDEQDRIIREFEETGGTLIQTTKYATSYEFLNGPEHNYCLGYEFDPEDNKQAEDRFQRVASTRPSFHWYIRFNGTYDDALIDRIVMKGQNVSTLLNKGKYWDLFT
jgi:hypothetical protein